MRPSVAALFLGLSSLPLAALGQVQGVKDVAKAFHDADVSLGQHHTPVVVYRHLSDTCGPRHQVQTLGASHSNPPPVQWTSSESENWQPIAAER